MSFFLRPALFALLFLSSPFASGDSPQLARQNRKQFSSNRLFFLISEVRRDRTQVFRAHDPDVVMWEVPIYLSLPYLSDDGRHIAAVYEGGNILGDNTRPSDPLITFYNASGTKRIVKVNEVVPELKTLRKTSSGREWGYVSGFGPSGRFVVVLDNGKQVGFEPEPPAR